MITNSQFELSMYMRDNKEFTEIDKVYKSFTIYEEMHNYIYIGELRMRNDFGIFKEYPIISGEEITIKIKIANDDIEKELIFLVFQTRVEGEDYIITLIPKWFLYLSKDKITKGFENKIDKTISDILSESNVNSGKSKLESNENNDSPSPASRKFMQLNRSGFGFIKYLSQFATESNKSGYMNFFNKENKHNFKSFFKIKSDTGKNFETISEAFIKNLRFEDKIISYQLDGGFSGKTYYWDWDNGEMKSYYYKITDSKFSLNDSAGINTKYMEADNEEKVSILMQTAPIGEDLYWDELYSQAPLQNSVFRKNVFNIYAIFDIFGNWGYTPGIVVEALFESSKEISRNEFYSGKWIIYSANHIFDREAYITNLRLGLPFYNEIKSSDYE